jgi:hypothetical protein
MEKIRGGTGGMEKGREGGGVGEGAGGEQERREKGQVPSELPQCGRYGKAATSKSGEIA